MNTTLRGVERPGGSQTERRRRGPRPRALGRLAFALLLVLYAAASYLPSSLARLQTPTPEKLPALPNPFVIDLTRPPSETQQYDMGEKLPEGNFPVDIRGDGKKWWLVQFEKVTPGVSFRVKDRVKGYTERQPLPQGTWFPIRERLPVLMIIGQTNTASPMSFRVKTGTLDEQGQGEVQNNEAKDVQDYVSTLKNFSRVKEVGSYDVNLNYGQYSVSSLNQSPLSGASVGAVAGTEGWGYWPYLIIFLIFLVVLVIVLLAKPWRPKRSNTNRDQSTRSGTEGLQTYRGERRSWFTSLPFIGRSSNAPPSVTPETHPSPPPPRPLGKRARPRQDSFTQETLEPNEAKLQGGGAPPGQGVNSEELTKVRGLINDLEIKLVKKNSEDEALSKRIEVLIEQKVADSVASLRDEITAQGEHVAREQTALEQQLRNEIAAAEAELHRVIGGVRDSVGPAVDERLRSVTEAWEKSASSLRKESERVAERLELLEREVFDKANELYNARVLGFLLENHVDALREENFGQLMDGLKERLERFFREEVGRDGDGSLRGLQERAGAVSEAFQAVVAKLSEMSADGDRQARRLAERVEGTAAEMDRLGAQLEEKQLDLAATVHIPVSAHTRARRTFLEELGLAIQREVAKLSDPLVHFQNELERLATSEVVGLADICDRRFPPGSNPELEERLKKLFELAGVDDIVPSKDGTFETGRQELIGMVDGRPQDSLKVAQVLSRGFIYTQDGTLLRKAGVKVYR